MRLLLSLATLLLLGASGCKKDPIEPSSLPQRFAKATCDLRVRFEVEITTRYETVDPAVAGKLPPADRVMMVPKREALSYEACYAAGSPKKLFVAKIPTFSPAGEIGYPEQANVPIDEASWQSFSVDEGLVTYYDHKEQPLRQELHTEDPAVVDSIARLATDLSAPFDYSPEELAKALDHLRDAGVPVTLLDGNFARIELARPDGGRTVNVLDLSSGVTVSSLQFNANDRLLSRTVVLAEGTMQNIELKYQKFSHYYYALDGVTPLVMHRIATFRNFSLSK